MMLAIRTIIKEEFTEDVVIWLSLERWVKLKSAEKKGTKIPCRQHLLSLLFTEFQELGVSSSFMYKLLLGLNSGKARKTVASVP